MRNVLNDAEAIEICRTRSPSVSAMKRVVDWAMAAPAADKSAALLVLESGNYASRKGLDAQMQGALVECGRRGTDALWECVAGDWDVYRVLHALRAIATINGQGELERLIELGRTRLMRMHWDAIRRAADAHGAAIPPDILAAQDRLEAERPLEDFSADFEARKPAWPARRDQEAAAAAGASIRVPEPSARRAHAEAAPATPAALAADGERNPFLRKYKSSRAGAWSLTRMERLYETVDLGYFLLALGRAEEALEVASYVADNITFAGNYNIWAPAGDAICLQARLLRGAGRAREAEDAIARLNEHPINTGYTKSADSVTEQLQGVPQRLAAADAERSVGTACRKFARTLELVSFYIETARAGFPHAQWYAVDALESEFGDGVARLRARLEAAK